MLKKGDFVEIDFIGRIKASNQIFDLTLKDVAEKEKIKQENHKYEPLATCLGENLLVPGLDEFLIGKEVGKEYEVDLLPEKAFGGRNPKLIRLTSLTAFKDQEVMPVPGVQVSIGGMTATIRSVTGGRVLLDFNHPLAGKGVHYWIKVNKQITDAKDKLNCLLVSLLAIRDADIKVEKEDAEIKIKDYKKIEKILEKFKEEAKRLVPEIKTMNFKEK